MTDLNKNVMPVVDRDLEDRPYVSMHVRVTNNNEFALSDRYDGIMFEFEPGKGKVIPAEAANHIFGWTPDASREHMFLHFSRRCGWNTPQFTENGKGRKLWDRIDIKAVQFRLVEVSDEEEEAGAPADGEQQTGTHDPRANARNGQRAR